MNHVPCSQGAQPLPCYPRRRDTAVDDLILNALGLPGYFVSVSFMGTLGPKFIQILGFTAMSALYFAIGILWNQGLTNYKTLLLILYGSTFFFANFGPNATTFLLPSMTFTHTSRSTLNGISAASGKLGAFLGATLFEPVSHASGPDSVMLICCGIAVVGLFFTAIGVDEHVGRIDKQQKPSK